MNTGLGAEGLHKLYMCPPKWESVSGSRYCWDCRHVFPLGQVHAPSLNLISFKYISASVLSVMPPYDSAIFLIYNTVVLPLPPLNDKGAPEKIGPIHLLHSSLGALMVLVVDKGKVLIPWLAHFQHLPTLLKRLFDAVSVNRRIVAQAGHENAGAVGVGWLHRTPVLRGPLPGRGPLRVPPAPPAQLPPPPRQVRLVLPRLGGLLPSPLDAHTVGVELHPVQVRNSLHSMAVLIVLHEGIFPVVGGVHTGHRTYLLHEGPDHLAGGPRHVAPHKQVGGVGVFCRRGLVLVFHVFFIGRVLQLQGWVRLILGPSDVHLAAINDVAWQHPDGHQSTFMVLVLHKAKLLARADIDLPDRPSLGEQLRELMRAHVRGESPHVHIHCVGHVVQFTGFVHW
mmetsp:Transcript_10873/g.16064  ORF Transcript_10873/g.16064 Transcript_10873/m.16064 type:complete len:395 (-) Transcript_10873:61-1245(-)